MRDIKFRVWHKDFKKFLPKEEWLLDFDGALYFKEILLYSGTLIAKSEQEFVVQQFTGLKDKNGKEIYEGDIVSYTLGDKKIRWVDLTEWESYGWVLKQHYYDGQTGSTPLCNLPDLLVIGNILENPELIEK